jgi:regulator of replication initiation timing
MANTLARPADIDAIDRLEDKVKQLVATLEQLRGEHARMREENAQLAGELEGLQARIAQAEGASEELVALREERDVIRGRVSEMLDQLESLNL